ncbi:hypothetical protein BDN72DRAFT_900556 [Pluteus cervinus]|uniref:Uncharacterized protein n=1 Tax=Pluteus cervinus TaxID=181527 RepID=A0ACD3AIK7_9AGAR|nr:hypothetical protein BDN72DRAFT_900556 [Pluteus cervinus]
MSEHQPERQPLLHPQDVERTEVYPNVRNIRNDVIVSLNFAHIGVEHPLQRRYSVCEGLGSYGWDRYIDTPLSYDALHAPDIAYAVIEPLATKYIALQRGGNMSIVFCFLLARIHFMRDDNIATASISKTRAELCEILAIRIFRDYGNCLMRLTLAITTSWPVYNGADDIVLARLKQEGGEPEDRVGNAIEMAILGKAKRFIKSTPCQEVINAIWAGKCVYQAQSAHSILSDTYKRNPVHFYDPYRAPLLDHYRLKVPVIRSFLDYINFLVLFVLFIVAIELNKTKYINKAEACFMVYALGFTLEKLAAMQEHGIKVYFKGTWNGFDVAFMTTFCGYGSLRLYGVYYDDPWARTLGVDCLALIACLMFPRLAFVTLRDNLMVLSLRAMMMQFLFLMLIAAFCFCGFLYALWTLSRDGAAYSAGTIAWWMLDLFFGLDASGFDRASSFHPFFGPILTVTYACLSNTLLLTVLVSILSNTFATINEDAEAEAMFRKAVSTIEGVKADVLFSYQPPINLIALCIMLPASWILSARWFHKVNVFMIRLTSFPLLLLIALYERQAKKNGTTGLYDTLGAVAEKVFDTLPRSIKRMSLFEGLAGSDADIDVIFEIEEELNNSALDTSTEDSASPEFRSGERRLSGMSDARPQPPPQAAYSQPIPAPRLRLNSHAPKMEASMSPLAQVYQLPSLDNGIPEEADSLSTGVTSGALLGRRRLLSMQHPAQRKDSGFSHPSQILAQQQHQHQQHAFPIPRSPRSPGHQQQTLTPPTKLGFPSRSLSSQDHQQQGFSESPQPIVLSEELADRDKEGSVMTRLEIIEKQQKRIEELLTQIANGMKSNGRSGNGNSREGEGGEDGEDK